MSGSSVTLFDLNRELTSKALVAIRKNLDIGVEKKKVTPEQRDEALARIQVTQRLDEIASSELVIEAVPEKLELKQELFKSMSRIVSESCILASNTSALSLTEIAASAVKPERVVGMHFFNPVHLMKLLEVVRAYQTSSETVETVKAYGKAIGKEVITVDDSPGFASTRLGIAVGLEAIRMLEERVASAEDIDRAMELRPPQLLKKMVKAGKLGKKSGEGFYRY
jgi:3-hydroxybutyryl-CoA dehydrogenase